MKFSGANLKISAKTDFSHSSAMPRVTITVPDHALQPYRFDLHRAVITIGRSSGNDIVVGSGSVSGKHAEMRRVRGGYELIDLDSTNGIKLDGIRKKKMDLATGMTVKLGDVELGFTLQEEELHTLAAEVESGHGGAEANDTSAPVQTENEDRSDVAGGSEHGSDEDDVNGQVPEKGVSVRSRLSFGFLMFAIVVVALAFFYGADKRHRQDTGEGLIKAILPKFGDQSRHPAAD